VSWAAACSRVPVFLEFVCIPICCVIHYKKKKKKKKKKIKEKKRKIASNIRFNFRCDRNR
jgi:hypothetical protein